MMEKMINPNLIDYYIINCAIPSMITMLPNQFWQPCKLPLETNQKTNQLNMCSTNFGVFQTF
mgnify:CR=1 FL=1